MTDSSQWMMLLRALGSLALVLALIFTLSWLARRYFQPKKWSKSFSGIRVVQSLPLGAKKRLMVVEVENRKLLIGVGADSISAICDFGAAELDSEKTLSEATG